MHYSITSVEHLIAQLPHFFGFDICDSLVLLTTSSSTNVLGPLLRVDLPAPEHNEELRTTLIAALKRLSDREFNELIVVVVSEDWTFQGATCTDELDELLGDVAYRVGFTLRDFLMSENCREGAEWISLFTGERGRVACGTDFPKVGQILGLLSTPESPVASERLVDSTAQGTGEQPAHTVRRNSYPTATTNPSTTLRLWESRESSREALLRVVDDVSELPKWEVRGSHSAFLSLPSETELRHYLDEQPTRSTSSTAAVVVRQFLLRTIESCQGADGLVSLLTDDSAPSWVAWMWVLLPTIERETRANFLLPLGLWYYLQGDGFRARTLIDKAAELDPHCAGVRPLQHLMSLCVDPQTLRGVVNDIAATVWTEGV